MNTENELTVSVAEARGIHGILLAFSFYLCAFIIGALEMTPIIEKEKSYAKI